MSPTPNNSAENQHSSSSDVDSSKVEILIKFAIREAGRNMHRQPSTGNLHQDKLRETVAKLVPNTNDNQAN
jgi:hypothetical protein